MTMPTLWDFFGQFPLSSCGCGLIMACSRLFASFWDPNPLLLFHWGGGSCPYLGGSCALRSFDLEETWRKANISLDLLTKYFSRSDFPVEFARDFIAGKKGWKKFRINAFKIAFAGDGERGIPMFCIQLLQLWFCSHLAAFLPASRPLITLRVSGLGRSLGGLQRGRLGLIVLFFDGVPLPGVWGCTGYYPSLALRQFGGVQYPPRLGDLSAVTFDYIPGEDMWRLLFRIEDIWGGRLSEMVLIEGGLPYGQVHHILRCLVPFGFPAPTGQSGRVAVLERELEEARTELSSLRLARASEREESAARVESMRSTLHHNSVAVANLRRDLELETEQVERTRVQDELDSLRSYTQALVDPSTGRPHDIVALRRPLDESEEALTSARTSMGAMRVQISVLQGDNGVLQTEVDLVHDALESNASWLNQEGFPVVTALHQINQVMDSLGARARAVLEEHDEGDPALSTALGRFCRETCIRLGH
uniref:Uncharacterized protein n=1 Tax=Fagus sylvatica TaxID=28930 RepID=A0A2N9FD16_FAGSY